MFEENTQIIIEEKRSGQQTETGKRRAFPDNQERQKPADQKAGQENGGKTEHICQRVKKIQLYLQNGNLL